jgi:hypothetical protein
VPKQVKLNPSGSSYKAVTEDQELSIKCNIPGSFNVFKLIGRSGSRTSSRANKSTNKSRGIAALQGVEGRMTIVDEGQALRCSSRFCPYAR